MAVKISGKLNTPYEDILRNAEAHKHYPRVQWARDKYPTCAVVGAGPSLKASLPILREWIGDIFAINDTAAYLSDHGIPSYMFMIDAMPIWVRDAELIQGAVLATRVHPMNFSRKNVRTYEMLEESENNSGIEGGPSAACRAPHLFLRMGYKGIAFFGCDSSFFGDPHLYGFRPESIEGMIVVRAGGKDYLTNAALALQARWLSNILKTHTKRLYNCSGGLLKAMVENSEPLAIVAVSEKIANEDEQSKQCWSKEYSLERLWRGNGTEESRVVGKPGNGLSQAAGR